MSYLKKFFAFWVDFIVGDDPVIALGVVAALALTWALAHADQPAWWLLPAVTCLLLAGSLIRAAMATRKVDHDKL